MNLWNLSQTKTHFFIRQRKQAQKRHLQKLKNTKSSIEILKNTQTYKGFHPVATRTIIADHQYQQKPKNSYSPGPISDPMISSSVRRLKLPNANSTYVQNLRMISSMSRFKHTKNIQKQNEKLYTRLIKAKPSISELQLKKNHINHQKYKENILKNKYLNPDYTKQVRAQTKSFSHLLLKPINNLFKAKQVKTFGNRIKEDIKSHYNILTNLTDDKFEQVGQV